MSRPRRASIAPLAGAVTPRERQVLHLLAEGKTNTGIAMILDLSHATVRTHVEHIYSKLDVANRVECVLEAMQRGLVELPVVDEARRAALKAVPR